MCYCFDVVYQGPYFERTRSHLQRVLGDDNVLSVNFEIEGKSPADSDYAWFKKVAKEGILVGLRRYRFFGASSALHSWNNKYTFRCSNLPFHLILNCYSSIHSVQAGMS